MLGIRDEQMKIFRDSAHEKFVQRILRHLRTGFGDHVGDRDEPGLRAEVEQDLAKGRQYGLVYELDLVRFVEYSVVHGSGFEDQPLLGWAGEILRAPALSGTAKMDRIDAEYERRRTSS